MPYARGWEQDSRKITYRVILSIPGVDWARVVSQLGARAWRRFRSRPILTGRERGKVDTIEPASEGVHW